MEYSLQHNPDRLPPPPDDRLHDIVEEWQKLGEDESEPYIAAHSRSAVRAMENSEIRTIVEKLFEDRPELTAYQATKVILRAVQANELEHNPRYPVGYDTEAPWVKAFKEILDFDKYGHFMINVRRDVTSNIADRYKLTKVVALLHRERFEGPVSVLDIGCSQNQGLKKMALARTGKFRFRDVEIVHPWSTESAADDKLLRSNELSSKFNRLMHRRLPLAPSLGIDYLNVDDPRIKNWTRSCSFYPSELLNPIRTEEYDLLDEARSKNVLFYRADFSNFDHEKFAHDHPDMQQYDIVNFSTMLYQLNDDERVAMVKNAMRYVKPSGLLVLIDYIQSIDPHYPDGTITFHDHWGPYTYGAWVLDMEEPGKGFQKYFTVEGGRVKRLQLEPPLGELAVVRSCLISPA